MSAILISVIIPVYRDWTRLKICLDALEEQIDPTGFEVIVINNDPTDQTTLTRPYSFPLAINIEGKPGSYAARNKGLQKAKGEALLFTDSDCIPDRDWIAEAKKITQSNPPGLFAGKIELFSEFSNRYVEFEKVFAFPNKNYVATQNFGVTANLLVHREVLRKIGGFNASLMTGGDADFCNRGVNEGFPILYCPELKVGHPARGSWQSFRTKALRFGGRLPASNNSFIMWLKLLGKFRIRKDDIALISSLPGISFSQKVDFFFIKQRMRWVEAMESVRVYLGKDPGRK
ncbi:glycosyltransferase family A protein [Algoriphagus halophytocola]|uniref:Glycosyltransferase family 2 protein n=1 Tax=Algoriphagus halophytocola TaxID=2991499 RepID=A0ABY6MGW4_9BACT|nr:MULTISPECIES: glycosyltransferase family A protein [unclassified Algoriphagus]UZD23040.1 glycosyltransferase family 2 protein [Algoriphagus sp. TR-M5]WBL44332.1 glycosyltransferase family A protein [Algoriphagus sp. TR-M9]